MGFGVWGLGFRVWGLGVGVWGLRFRVSGLGCSAQGLVVLIVLLCLMASLVWRVSSESARLAKYLEWFRT